MLPGMTGMMTGVSSAASGNDLLSIIQSLSLTTNLQLCLDAGDSASYSGSGQTWNDRSGGGYNFYRGADGSAGGTDPTFNGTPGALSSSNYWSYNGSQYFTLAQSNPAWVNNIHKAGAVYTIAQWVYLNGISSLSQNFACIGDSQVSPTEDGIGFLFASSIVTLLKMNLYLGSTIYNKDTTTSSTNNTWNFIAVSVNISTGVVTFNLNGTAETYTSQTYQSPFSVSASATLQIGAAGNGTFPEHSGNRVAEVAMWGGTALSSANLISLYNATRARFGV